MGDQNAKSRIQEMPGLPGNFFALEYKIKQGKGWQSFAKKTHQSQQTPSPDNTREDLTHGRQQMVNTEIRLIIFFEAKDGEALYSQQKQDQEMNVAQIMNSLLKTSDLNEESRENQ